MPLFIRDNAVNEMADKLAHLMGGNKTDAVRRALEAQIAALEQCETLTQRVARLQARARAAGLGPDGFDDKVLMDELSGGL